MSVLSLVMLCCLAFMEASDFKISHQPPAVFLQERADRIKELKELVVAVWSLILGWNHTYFSHIQTDDFPAGSNNSKELVWQYDNGRLPGEQEKSGSFTVSHVTLYYFVLLEEQITQLKKRHTQMSQPWTRMTFCWKSPLAAVGIASYSFTHLAAYLPIFVHKTALGSSSLMVGRSEQITIFLVNHWVEPIRNHLLIFGIQR